MKSMNNWIESVIAVSTGLMMWLVEQTPDDITLLSLIYVILASGAGLGCFRLIVKFYQWWAKSTEERYQRHRKNSREDLNEIIDRQDRIIADLREELKELKT